MGAHRRSSGRPILVQARPRYSLRRFPPVSRLVVVIIEPAFFTYLVRPTESKFPQKGRSSRIKADHRSSECFRRDFRQNYRQKTDFALAHKMGLGPFRPVCAATIAHADFPSGLSSAVSGIRPGVTGVPLGQTGHRRHPLPCFSLETANFAIVKEIQLTQSELAFIIATRAMIGAGIALLFADRLSAEQRKAVGATLALAGLVTTIPAVWAIFGKCRQTG